MQVGGDFYELLEHAGAELNLFVVCWWEEPA